MRSLLALFLFVQLAVIAPAQEKRTQDKAAPETSASRPVESPWRVFELKFADPTTFAETVRNLGTLSVPLPAQKFVMVRVDEKLMPAIEELAKRLDVPAAVRKNVDLEISLVEASTEPLPDVSTPSALEPVIKQLKAAFAYKGFRVLDTLLLRSRAGEAVSTQGHLTTGKEAGDRGMYTFSCRPSLVEAPGTLVRLDQMRLRSTIPVRFQSGENRQVRNVEIQIDSQIDVKPGQRVVVGKTGIEGSDRALILVLSAKVVD